MDSDKNAKLSFETALTKLEAIVDSMEQGEVPLAELLVRLTCKNTPFVLPGAEWGDGGMGGFSVL